MIAVLTPAELVQGNLLASLREHTTGDENLRLIVQMLDVITSTADTALMEKVRREFETRFTPPDEAVPFDSAIPWTKWLGRGRDVSDLHTALRYSGNEEPKYETQFSRNATGRLLW